MHYQQYRSTNPANRMPALLAIDHAVFAEDEIRVSEDPRCCLKIYAGMLSLV